MERYHLEVLPDKHTVRGLVYSLEGSPCVIFLIEEGVFVWIRIVPDEDLPDVSSIPSREILEAFINKEAFFDRDTGKFKMKQC